MNLQKFITKSYSTELRYRVNELGTVLEYRVQSTELVQLLFTKIFN